MAAMANSIKHLDETNNYPAQTVPKNCRGRENSQIHSTKPPSPDTKADKDITKKDIGQYQ